MKVVILILAALFLVSCGEESFKKAEMSECLNGTAAANVIQSKVEITEETDEMVMPDEESDDSDVVEDEQVTKVILIEKKESEISFYYQSNFACSGMEYGYEIEPDSADMTVLDLSITSNDTTPNSNVKCLCLMKMTVKYSSNSDDLTKITKIKVVYDEDPEKILEF